MPFPVDFNRASQAIIETIAIPFPSLEVPKDTKVADATPPKLESGQVSPVTVTSLGNGRWRRDSSMQFNAGVNDDLNHAPDDESDRGLLTQDDAEQLEKFFMSRYAVSGATPKVLKNHEKWNLTVVRNHVVYNFHILVKLT
jgi:hypothetical protein